MQLHKFNHQRSTRPANMSDFITLNVGHSAMRYNQQVIQHTIYFLQTGVFMPIANVLPFNN